MKYTGTKDRYEWWKIKSDKTDKHHTTELSNELRPNELWRESNKFKQKYKEQNKQKKT